MAICTDVILVTRNPAPDVFELFHHALARDQVVVGDGAGPAKLVLAQKAFRVRRAEPGFLVWPGLPVLTTRAHRRAPPQDEFELEWADEHQRNEWARKLKSARGFVPTSRLLDL